MIKNFVHQFSAQLQVKKNSAYYLSFFLLTSLLIHFICISKAKLLVEEAYYWNYSQHLDWSYLDHPPMVALLIKLFTLVFGTTEVAVRSASLFCWSLSTFFTYRLCELIRPQSGRYAILLLAILPFFFFQSIIITPDVPLIVCWSACLYFLYRALILQQPNAWYFAGLWLGLGMLSKYTICLLPLTTLGYMLTQKEARFWFKRIQPYTAALISFLLFTPVIYWNAQHEWISFIFQSSRRINTVTSIHLQDLLIIVLFYITPLGLFNLWMLAKQRTPDSAKKFSQYFTFIPLVFFALYSINHEVNFNWTGPLFLALIPWIASSIMEYPLQKALWFSMASALLVFYSSALLVVSYNRSEYIQQKLFIKVIAWDDLIKKINTIAADIEQKKHEPVVLVPLDNYPINSELAFYQTKLLNNKLISKRYPTTGAHIFHRESLMYKYWSSNDDLNGKLILLLSKEPWRFEDPAVADNVLPLSAPQIIWSLGQGQNLHNIPFYYQLAHIKPK